MEKELFRLVVLPFFDLCTVCRYNSFQLHNMTMYVGVKKVPIYCPYNRMGNSVPFYSHLVSVCLLFSSIFNPFPCCPMGSPSAQVNGLGSGIECTQVI